MSNPILTAVRENIERVIIGKTAEVELLLVALASAGHVLLEDVPGTGKTTLAKALAASISGTFRRVQFTPDLLPTDLTGLNVYSPKTGAFSFKPGALFTHILLADEINRATPRTQSGLLECMEERQITIDGETYALEAPYFVIATQNPVETQGTFPLPEAQLDRFLMQLDLGYPTREGEAAVITRFLHDSPLEDLQAVSTPADWIALQAQVRAVRVHPDLCTYITELAAFTRRHTAVFLGVSPRASLAAARAAQGYAVLQGRGYVIPEDIKYLLPYVWPHRLILRGAMVGNPRAKKDVITEALGSVPVPTEQLWG